MNEEQTRATFRNITRDDATTGRAVKLDVQPGLAAVDQPAWSPPATRADEPRPPETQPEPTPPQPTLED